MRRLLLAAAVLVAGLTGIEPASASGAVAVSGVIVFSPGIPLVIPTIQSFTLTETLHGVFDAGTGPQVATVFCSYNGSASESTLTGSAAMGGTCSGTSVSGVPLTMACVRTYARLLQHVQMGGTCTLTIGTARKTSLAMFASLVAHVPVSATDRYYYDGVIADV